MFEGITIQKLPSLKFYYNDILLLQPNFYLRKNEHKRFFTEHKEMFIVICANIFYD